MSKVKRISTVWSKLFKIFTKKQKRKYFWVVALGILSAVLEILGISMLLHTVLAIMRPDFIDHNVITSWLSNVTGITDQLPFVAMLATILLAIYIIKNVLIVQINKAQVHFAYSTTEKIAEARYNQIANEDLLYFKNRKTSDIVNELFGGAIYLPETVIMPSIMLLSEIFLLSFIMLGVLFYKPFLFVMTFVTIVPTAGLLIYFNRKRLAKKGAEVHKINPVIYDNVTQLTQGIANIKLWNGMAAFSKEFNAKKEESFAFKKSIYVSAQFIPIRMYEVVAIAGLLCVVLFTIYNNKGSTNLINYVALYAGVSFRLIPSINRIIGSFNNLATNSYVLDYFKDFKLDKNAKIGSKNIDPMPFNSSLELANIEFSYEPNLPVLTNLNMVINKGDFIGIIGTSGSGKSTMVNVLTSLIQPNEGEVKIDGKTVSRKEKQAYRYLYSYVKQDVFMLNSTIKKNITFLESDKKFDGSKLEKSLAQVNLDDWVSTLPKGIDTEVGELGNSISGGQKQRIAIARALYKNAEVFIFDEATNNLDSESTEQTLNAIKKLKDANKTAIFITHKKDELQLCNRIFTLKEGKLVEEK